MRKTGILASVSSLPGSLGIGDFGNVAYEFVDMMVDAGIKIWQILPMNPVGYGNSPYQPYSSYAGDEIYISQDGLVKLGLLQESECVLTYSTDKVEYSEVRELKQEILHKAFLAFQQNSILQKEMDEFVQENNWVSTYAVFITLKKLNHLQCWLDWPIEQKEWFDKKEYDMSIHSQTIQYETFVQFIFYKQWLELKQYANERNVEILGDIPIYVGIDSADVWSNKVSFLLDENCNPTSIAGVPPDYFSETGQRWGNPIYDWDYLEKTGFTFWIERLRWSEKIFDQVRIDHFRAFDTYWKIPATCPTAIEGEWIEAPGYALFDTIYQQLPNIKIVAEDLGDLRPEVLELRDHYQLPGMGIIQFEVNGDDDKIIKEEKRNAIIYTGTHDNHTLVSWLADFNKKELKNMKTKYAAYSGKKLVDKIIESAYASVNDVVIFPLQDILRLDNDARMNTPGTVGNPNWQWKLQDYKDLKKAFSVMKRKNIQYKR